VGPHEGFADEDGVGTGVEDALGVVHGLDAGLGDEEDGLGDLFGESFGGGEIDGEGFEVAVVDADEVGAEFEGAFHFGEVVDLDEDIELEGLGDVVEVAEGVVVEAGDDEEDGVGAGDDGFVDLDLVDDEVLTQQRDGGALGDAGEVGEGALEEFFVGEDGHGAGATVDVHAGLFEGIEVGVDDAGGGGGLFDFGDDAELVGTAVEGGAEAAELVALEGGGAEFRGAGEEGFHLGAFVGDDFGEFVHGAGRGGF